MRNKLTTFVVAGLLTCPAFAQATPPAPAASATPAPALLARPAPAAPADGTAAPVPAASATPVAPAPTSPAPPVAPLVLPVPPETPTGGKVPGRAPVPDPNGPPPLPEDFRGSLVPVGKESIGDLTWFDIFKDEQLRELIRKALVANPDIRSAVVNIYAAQAQLKLTGANEFPTIQAGGNINTIEQSTHIPTFISGFVPRAYSVGEVFLNFLSFELDIWGRVRNQTQAAVQQLLATEEDRRTMTTMIVSQVASDYFNLIELDQELEISRATLQTRQNSLELIKARQEGGVATMLEVRQGEELVQQAQVIIPDLVRQIEQMENNIQLLIGQMPGPIARGKVLVDQEQLPTVPAGLPSALLERRPDIRSAEFNLQAQHHLVASARAAYYPQITLTGLFGFQSSALSNLFTNGSRTQSFQPSITGALFNAGKFSANESVNLDNEQLALIKYQKTVFTAFNEVSNALVQYSRVHEQRTLQETLVLTLRDRQELSYLRYRGGVDTLLNALDADRDLFNAQLTVAQSRRNELVAMVQLYRALGGGWQVETPQPTAATTSAAAPAK